MVHAAELVAFQLNAMYVHFPNLKALRNHTPKIQMRKQVHSIAQKEVSNSKTKQQNFQGRKYRCAYA